MTGPSVADRNTRRRRGRDRPVPGWLARRGTRRALALSAAIPLVCGFVAAQVPRAVDERWGPGPLVGLVGVVAFVVCWPLLRRVTALLADAPDADLDEREREERGQVFLRSYQILAGLVAFVTTTGLLGGRDEVDLRQVLTGLLLTAVLVPSAVTAWRWRDAPE